MNKNRRKENNKWPKKEKLFQAIKVIENFRSMCRHQLDLGYWATVDFPTKHHINRILALAYLEKSLSEKIYGPSLVKRAEVLIPICKQYLLFVKDPVNEDIFKKTER